MSSSQKFLIGLVLGYVGYMAYRKLKGTQTVIVNSLDQPVPEVTGYAHMSDQIV